ncbi:MAG: prephenate dehydratase, partial [Actinomycetota bacterium]|nr:prephenate dehydratase [Actinomycetota bacterium]
AARSINLTKLESRPTKTNLGDYCFIIDLEGHVVDEVVADCLRNLKMKQGGVKFLGSYPAAANNGAEVRAAASADWQAAKGWVEAIRRGEAPPV